MQKRSNREDKGVNGESPEETSTISSSSAGLNITGIFADGKSRELYESTAEGSKSFEISPKSSQLAHPSSSMNQFSFFSFLCVIWLFDLLC